MLALHASCVAFDGQGVLILGAAGAGKSTLAQRLMDAGAVLVADDAVLVEEKNGGGLVAAPHPRVAGLFALRGGELREMPYLPQCTVHWMVDVDEANPVILSVAKDLGIVARDSSVRSRSLRMAAL